MLVTFHLFANFLYTLYKTHWSKNSWKQFTLTKQLYSPLAQRDAENDIKFDPPMYKQRYERAAEILNDKKWKKQLKKVLDFGCSELNFFVFLKNTIPAREILFVDIDEVLLRDSLYKVYPLNADHLTRRERPLNVRVYAGSVAHPDQSLLNTDAVVALELIEHLYPDTLDAFPYNLFGYICPKIAIITTPNCEFNVLFNKLKKFRHFDHKFEWTREQFESWATNITTRFPNYAVQFEGIGLGPQRSETFGCCSQLAVFLRKDIICDNVEIIRCVCPSSTCLSNFSQFCSCNCAKCLPKYSYGICTYNTYSKRLSDSCDDYRLVLNIDYPHEVDSRSEEEKVLDELKYRMHLFGSHNEKYYNEEMARAEIPLRSLVYVTSQAFPSVAEVRAILTKFNYQIEEYLNEETKQIEPFVIYEMDNERSENEASGYESDKYETENEQISDWDEKDVSTWNESPKDTRNQLSLEVSSSKKQQEALFDSGYQKSPSVPDDSPQSQKESLSLESRNEKPNKLSNILSVFTDFDKINEADACHKEKKFFNFQSNLPTKEVMKKLCEEIAKHPIAGPSRDLKRNKAKKPQSSDSEESVEEIKSVATCILENSLNKIESNEAQKGDVIEELIEPVIEEIAAQEVLQPVLLVENGDLANNNRDVEGNNYENFDPAPQNYNAVDNVDPNNVNVDNNNEVVEVPEEVEEEVEAEAPVIEVAWSSREALFDVNSQVDLLEEFEDEAPPPNVECNSVSVANDAVLPEESGFPNWLLQIFEEGEVGVAEEELHEEPDFYCQGDGLGVHPSIVALDVEADDENDSDSSSSSSGSADFANAENLVVLGQAVLVDQDNSEAGDEETFENAEESESNLVSSCTQ